MEKGKGRRKREEREDRWRKMEREVMLMWRKVEGNGDRTLRGDNRGREKWRNYEQK